MSITRTEPAEMYADDPDGLATARAERQAKLEDLAKSAGDELHTPEEWAAIFGAGTVAADWDLVEEKISIYNPPGYFTMGPTRDRKILRSQFIDIAQASAARVNARDERNHAASARWVGPIPTVIRATFAPTAEQVLDAVSTAGCWESLASLAYMLAQPFGYSAIEIPDGFKRKVDKLIKPMIADGTLVRYDRVHRVHLDHVGPKADRNSNVTLVTTPAQLDEWRRLRDEQNTEEARREDVVYAFSRDHLCGSNLWFSYKRNAWDPAARDGTTVEIGWADFEQLARELADLRELRAQVGRQ